MSDKSNDACVVCPYWLSRRPELSPIAKLVYGRFFRAAADVDFDWFFPDFAAIAASLGLTKGQITYYAARLRALGLLESVWCLHPEGSKVQGFHVNPEHPWILEAQGVPAPSPILFDPEEEYRRVQAKKKVSHLRLVP